MSTAFQEALRSVLTLIQLGLAVTATLLLVVARASAATVTVTPEMMHGWSIAITPEATDGENPARLGEWWSVRGYLERLPFAPPDGPMCIWTAAGHMRRIHSPPSSPDVRPPR